MIVGNNDFTAFDGVVFDRMTREFHQLSRVEFLSCPLASYSIGASKRPAPTHEQFDRQTRIHRWDQHAWEALRIGIIGAGGNGVPVFTSLLCTGAGRNGFIAIADDGCIEASNLSRNSCACAEHLGQPKINPLMEHARRKSPETTIHAFHQRFEHPLVQQRFKMANVLLVCGDNDGLRQTANQFAIRYGIPLIDLGSDIQVSDTGVISGGQVRVVIPGENACLVCCGGFSAAQAALDNMDEEQRAHHRAAGYVRGALSDASPTPSIANLNGLTAELAIAHLIGLVQGAPFCAGDYAHIDQLTLKTLTAKSNRRDDCPVCGINGYLGAGDESDESPALRANCHNVVCFGAYGREAEEIGRHLNLTSEQTARLPFLLRGECVARIPPYPAMLGTFPELP